MYTIRLTKGFEKSFKKIRHSGLTKKNERVIASIVDVLAAGKILDKRYKDHQLMGNMKDYRECHVLNDLLLMYRIDNEELVLLLIDIGSHSQLFG